MSIVILHVIIFQKTEIDWRGLRPSLFRLSSFVKMKKEFFLKGQEAKILSLPRAGSKFRQLPQNAMLPLVAGRSTVESLDLNCAE